MASQQVIANLDARKRSTHAAMAIVQQKKVELAETIKRTKKKFIDLTASGSTLNRLHAMTQSSLAKQRDDTPPRNSSVSASKRSLKATHKYVGRPKSSRSTVGSVDKHHLKAASTTPFPSNPSTKRKSLKTEIQKHTENLNVMYNGISKRKEEIKKKQGSKDISKTSHRRTLSFTPANLSLKESKKIHEKSGKLDKSASKSSIKVMNLDLGLNVSRRKGSKYNLLDRSTSFDKKPFYEISTSPRKSLSRNNSWTRTLSNKPVKEASFKLDGRENSDVYKIYNLFNQCYISIIRPRAKVRTTLGKGNNHGLVWRILESRGAVEYNQTPATSQLVWSQCFHPQSKPSSISSAGRYHLKHIVNSDSELIKKVTQGSCDSLTEELMAAKLFRFDTNQATISFERLINTQKVCCISGENLSLVNHIRGLKQISRKHDLAHTVIDFCKRVGIDPFIIIPKTLFLRRQHLAKDLDDTIKKIGEARKGFDYPCILKPGEFTNRGTGVVLAYSEEELRNKCRELFAANKKVANAVVQSYIHNPLLFKGRKFDIRCYALVVKSFAKTSVFWYRNGYMRTSSFEYNVNTRDNLMVHLTNEAVQVKDQQCFGKFEPGNKVYYEEIDRYYSDNEHFQRQNKRFLQDIVPLMKVKRSLHRRRQG